VLQPNLPVVLSLWGTDLMGRYGPVGEWCARHCEEVVVMSEEMATYLDRDVSVIPHGVNLDTFQPRPKREARAELGWAADEYHVLFPYPPTREVKTSIRPNVSSTTPPRVSVSASIYRRFPANPTNECRCITTQRIVFC